MKECEHAPKRLLKKIIGEGKNQSGFLKKDISEVTKIIEAQIQNLRQSNNKFDRRDKNLFHKLIKAYSERDQLKANVLANELSQIRRLKKTLTNTELALESVAIRLKSIKDLGDVVTTIGPALNILNEVKVGISTIMPEAGKRMEEIGTTLSEIVNTTSTTSEMPINFGATDEAQEILKEAESQAELQLRDQLPDVESSNIKKRSALKGQT